MDHIAELGQNWESAQTLQRLVRIPGADND
jgi:hypothetical protein